MPASALDPSDPMSSMNALLAAAQAQAYGNSVASLLPSTSSSSPSPSSAVASSTPPAAAASASSSSGPAPVARPSSASAAARHPPSTEAGGTSGRGGSGSNGQGVDLSSAVANVSKVSNKSSMRCIHRFHLFQLQLYYYMQKVAAAGMGNPKERKECPICGKTLYDRSTWNRHMRIHTGEKPYPCKFCGRRFRTNYNKLGHEKKCPDRHARLMAEEANAGSGAAANAASTAARSTTAAAAGASASMSH